jgi:hypothetical protein
MFGHDKHDDDKDEDVVQPSTQPVNEGLLGVNDDSTSNDDSDDKSADDPTDIGVESGTEVNQDGDDSDEAETAPAASDFPETDNDTSSNELLDIKREALQQLSPLVSHLEQTPEEKFKTTMMMIQATDDKTLIGEAFAAAKEISDDKARAQALLDIINEINYFTQPKKD